MRIPIPMGYDSFFLPLAGMHSGRGPSAPRVVSVRYIKHRTERNSGRMPPSAAGASRKAGPGMPAPYGRCLRKRRASPLRVTVAARLRAEVYDLAIDGAGHAGRGRDIGAADGILL